MQKSILQILFIVCLISSNCNKISGIFLLYLKFFKSLNELFMFFKEQASLVKNKLASVTTTTKSTATTTASRVTSTAGRVTSTAGRVTSTASRVPTKYSSSKKPNSSYSNFNKINYSILSLSSIFLYFYSIM